MIKFGPSGNSESFYAEGYTKTEQVPKWLKDRGLDCFEYSFGRGINMGDEKASLLKDAFAKESIEVSVHAPYYINFANEDEEKIASSINYVIESAKKVKLMGGTRVIFHPASQGKATREHAMAVTKQNFEKLTAMIYANSLEDLTFCPETMGKIGQMGTPEEIIELCSIDKVYIPTIDFGHVNSRYQGILKTETDYENLLQQFISGLGMEKMKNFHSHFSKIQYSGKGEVKHLTFSDEIYGPEFTPLAISLKKLQLEPHILCESAGTQAEDSQEMKKIYYNI
jgi:deoxyribonuclease-4